MSEAVPDIIARDGAFSVQPLIELGGERLAKLADAYAQQQLSDTDNLPHFIVDELCRQELAAQWRNALILVAENLPLNDEQLRSRLRQRLSQFASSLRHSTEAGITPIVHSAIRCFASMIPVSEADSLRPFLEPPQPVETRLVTLQSIIHLFEANPVNDRASHQPLRDRVYELARKFLDRDWLVPGEKAAIGQNAVLALAAMGDERASRCIETIRQLDMKWLTRQITSKFENLLSTWAAEPRTANHPAVQLVEQQLTDLRSKASMS